jgi:hypothetical protein
MRAAASVCTGGRRASAAIAAVCEASGGRRSMRSRQGRSDGGYRLDVRTLAMLNSKINYMKILNQGQESCKTTTPSVPKCLSLYASRESTLIKYILKNINIYGI